MSDETADAVGSKVDEGSGRRYENERHPPIVSPI